MIDGMETLPTQSQGLVGLLPGEAHGALSERRAIALLVAVLAVGTAAMVVYNAYFGTITALIVRSWFFSTMSSAGLLLAALKFRWAAVRFALYALAVIALVPGPYLGENFVTIITMGGMATPTDEVLFVGVMIVLFAVVSLRLGWPLVMLSAVALLYAVFGYLIPGRYGHGGYDLSRLTSTLFLSTEGIYGVPMGVAVDYIFLFALFGVFLMKTGTGRLFVDLARAITGRTPGGPGLSAVLASSMLGMLNGSAVANVVTVGTFTIPLMKRVGYTATVAGAIEAAASSAGQILPPVMGAAAFLMAEIIGMPYSQIAFAAILPSFLYVLALFVAVRLEAGKLALACDEAGGLRIVIAVLRRQGYMLLPLIALVALLIADMTPMRAAVMSLGLAFLLMPWSKASRVSPMGLVAICVETVTATVPIIAAIAAAGVVIGVLSLTGLGLMVSGLILDLGGNNLWLVLLLTAGASFILGMGLPTSAAYLLLAVLVAPALVQMGLPPIAAHMFIFYYGLVSAITPPVALSAYAAAAISGADSTETAIEAVRLGFVKLLVPFLFVSMPSLLMIGSVPVVIAAALLSTVGITGLSTAFAGWLGHRLSPLERAGFIVASLLVLVPVPIALDAINLAARSVGCIGLAFLAFRCWRMAREAAADAIPA